MPLNADHIHRAADDPYHSLYVKTDASCFRYKTMLTKGPYEGGLCAFEKNRGAYDAWLAKTFSNALHRKGM